MTQKEYVDLTDADRNMYECQRCHQLTSEDFERHNCPNCDTHDGIYAAKEWAKEFTPVDHGPGFTGNKTRTVRL